MKQSIRKDDEPKRSWKWILEWRVNLGYCHTAFWSRVLECQGVTWGDKVGMYTFFFFALLSEKISVKRAPRTWTVIEMHRAR